MLRTIWLLGLTNLIVPFLSCQPAAAQGSGTSLGFNRPVEGATGGLSKGPASPTPSDLGPGVRVHLDPYGKRCVAVGAKAHVAPDFRKIFNADQSSGGTSDGATTPKLFEHVVSAENHCAFTIKLRVCYYGSLSCLPLDVPAYGHQRTILGVSSSGPDFRYQYTEQF
jgi:hypothetical protein